MITSLRKFHDFFDLDSDMDYLFRPVTMRNFFFDDSSDEELSNRRRYIQRARKNIFKKKPKEDSSTFVKSFYQKSTVNKKGEPETYSYENQVEHHFKDGHKYSKRVQNITKNGKTKIITDKRIDNKSHRTISEKNEDGTHNQKNFIKGFKEQKMIDFDRTFDENFNQIHGQKTKNFLESDDYQNPRLFIIEKDNKKQEENVEEINRQSHQKKEENQKIRQEQIKPVVKEEEIKPVVKEVIKSEAKEEKKEEEIKPIVKEEEIKKEIKSEVKQEVKKEEFKSEVKQKVKEEEIKPEAKQDKKDVKKEKYQQDNDDIVIENEENNGKANQKEEEIYASLKNIKKAKEKKLVVYL